MKNLRIVEFMLFALFFTGVAFAQAPIDPYLYGDFPPEEADQHLEDFLPVYFNGQGFLEPEVKDKIGQLIQLLSSQTALARAMLEQTPLAQVQPDPYRDDFNLAVIYATPTGGVWHYGKLTDTDAAKAIDYATRAMRKNPLMMPYMYLVRAETYHRQGVPSREVEVAPVLDRDMALKAMKDYEMVLKFNQDIAPMTRICSLAESLGDNERILKYCFVPPGNPVLRQHRLYQQRQEEKQMEKDGKVGLTPLERALEIRGRRPTSAKPISLPLDKKLVPIGGKKAPVTRDLFKGVPRRAN